MRRVISLLFLGLLLCIGTSALGQDRADCGDVNSSGGIDIADLVYLIDYLVGGGPAPPDPSAADVDMCGGIDLNDDAYLVNYIFGGGPEPCTPGAADCALYGGGEVTLASVTGLLDEGRILAGEPVTFYLRVTNNTALNFGTICNAFRVYSLDGATWGDISIDTVVNPLSVGFDTAPVTRYMTPNGSGADTVGAAAMEFFNNPGLAPGDSHVLWRIDLPAFDGADVGKTICLDSSFREPGMAWKWSTNGLDSYAPSWDGPHCFTIAETPDTRVSLDAVHYGDLLAGTIEADRIVTFDLRFQYYLDVPVAGLTNGFRVFSTDGATWTTTWLDSTGALDTTNFDLFHGFSYFSIDGQGADTVGIAGVRISATGMPAGFDDVPYVINIGPIDTSHVGQTICVDSCFFPPSGTWTWVTDYDYYVPSWSGQRCFEIVMPTTPVHELAVSPDTLEFFAFEGYPSPPPQVFLVEEVVHGDSIEFQCDWIESFVNIPDPAGVTPQMVEVQASSEGYAVGEYYSLVQVWSPDASNTVSVMVKLTVEEAPVNADSLILPSVTLGWDHMAQPVVTKLTQPIRGATIPLKIPPDVVIDSIVNTGLVTENWEYSIGQVNEAEGYLLMGLANTHDATIPIGETEVFNIFFHPTWAHCLDSTAILWDTALSADPIHPLLYADINNMELEVGFDRYRDLSWVMPYTPGDIMANGGVSIDDLVYLVVFMFQDGPDLPLYDAADVNQSCSGPNIADLTYLVYYMFQDGPAPLCGCVQGWSAKIASRSDITLSYSFENGVTQIEVSSEVTLRGLQLDILSSVEGAQPTGLVENGWDLVYGGDDGIVHVGMLDLDGGATLESGTHALFSIPGECRIVSALISDANHQEWQPTVQSKSGSLPTEFALHQNYPNPFNPTTEISFSLKQAADVHLDIYNVVGQLVTRLVDLRLEAGQHSVTWNTTGSQTASGVYFYRLTADDFTDTKKMLLLK